MISINLVFMSAARKNGDKSSWWVEDGRSCLSVGTALASLRR